MTAGHVLQQCPLHDGQLVGALSPANFRPESVVAGEDPSGEVAFRQPGRPAVNSSLRAENPSFRSNDLQEEEEVSVRMIYKKKKFPFE